VDRSLKVTLERKETKMRKTFLLMLAAAIIAPDSMMAQPAAGPQLREWPVEWGGRTRDPHVAPDGRVWFVGQAGNYLAAFDPATESFRRYEIEEGTYPHTVIVDGDGFAWYAGNRNGRIGRVDPRTGDVRLFMMPAEVRDPHTMVFDNRGSIWFTAQGSNRIGRMNMTTGAVELVTPYEEQVNPYGIVTDADGNAWVALLRSNMVARIDPATLEVTRFRQKDAESRSRRIEWTSDGMVWYADEQRGYLGRIDPRTSDVSEWAMPGGPGSRPYALTKDDQERLWISETGPVKQLVGFDPRTETFFSVELVSDTIRHMMFDRQSGALWFGTDANRVGRKLVGTRVAAH
jgi:virginiamycin B lyase